MIRWFLDLDDDFDVSAGLDISDEVLEWSTDRAADGISRAETRGSLSMTLRRGRSLLGWWREGRLIEGRVGDFVFFRGFVRDASGIGDGGTRVRALTWLRYMAWRGRTPDVVGLSTVDALRAVVNAAAAGLPGARIPSPAVVEHLHDDFVGRRLYWRGSDRPLYWRDTSKPLYWRYGPITDGRFAYGRVGDTDTISDRLLVGPPPPRVIGESSAVVDRLTAVEYDIENFEYGRFVDEIAVLASGERGWIFSGGANDIDCVGRADSAVPPGMIFEALGAVFGRYEYEWGVGDSAVAQIVGRLPDVQESVGVLYRQENVFAPVGVSSWRVPVRDRGRPAEATGALSASWPAMDGVSVGASASAGDILIEVFNNSGAATRLDWIEVSGMSRVYQGGAYGDVVTGRYGGESIELRGVFGGAAGLESALDYWSVVLAEGGPELTSITLDGRRFDGAWGGQIGDLLRSDALQREGVVDGATDYWIVGVRGAGRPEAISVTYELMRYVDLGA